VRLQLGYQLSQLAMSYLDFCMHDVAMRAANESIRHLDAGGNADPQNPARWQALEALAVSAFNTRNEPLMRESLEQMASGVEAAARAKNNALGFVNAAQLWAQLVENLLVMGVPFSDLQVYYDNALRCIKAAGWNEAQARQQLQFEYPNFLAVLKSRK
jgi:hypothetical protein